MSEPRVARIQNGIVQDVVIATLEDAQAAYPEYLCVDVTECIAGPGWSWDGATFLPPPPPPVTESMLVDAVQTHLDATARTRNYDGILSLCSYVGDPSSKFAHEGRAGVAWRSAVWTYCYQVLDDVQHLRREPPSIQQLISELPQINWDL